jgi:hypothetical protein
LRIQQAVELFRLALNAQALLVHPLTGGGQGQRAVQFSSLNQAADYLGITQSAITRRLQRLEQELNVTDPTGCRAFSSRA